MRSPQAVKCAFFVDHWIPLVFLVSAVCDRLGEGRLESAVSCSEELNHFQRLSEVKELKLFFFA